MAPRVTATTGVVFTALTLVVSSCARTETVAHDCAHATAIVRRGSPSLPDEWAWARVYGCDEAGRAAVRDAWESLRSETDTTRIAAVYNRLWSFRDGALFDVLRSTFMDGAASPQVRVYSAMFLVGQLLDHDDPDYATFSATTPDQVCVADVVSDRSISTGTPLPSDARNQVMSAAADVLSDAGAPAAVKNAAHCVDDMLQRDARIQVRKPLTPLGG